MFKPMLATNVTEKQIEEIINKTPLYVSAKYDGVRALVRNGEVVSRQLKPIPNSYIQEHYSLNSEFNYEGVDGELIVGTPKDKDTYLNTSSAVRKVSGVPDVSFWLFDYISDDIYEKRLQYLYDHYTMVIPQYIVQSLNDILEFEAKILKDGYEGIVLRSPTAKYKYGRSTVNETALLKLKRFTNGEATIINMEEKLHNANEATTDALGHTKRSSHQENKVGMDTMGSLVVRDIQTGIEFNIGTGFNDEQRIWFWNHMYRLIKDAAIIKYKSFEKGVKDSPRFPVYLGLRDIWDL